jgi:hypothetical protein
MTTALKKSKDAHWERIARKLVVDSLVRAAVNMDFRSEPGGRAHRRLFEMARAEDPVLLQEVLDEREAFHRGFTTVMADILGPPARRRRASSKRRRVRAQRRKR